MTFRSLAIPGGPHDSVEHRDLSVLKQTRSSFLQLQALVTVVLSYQLLFSQHLAFPSDAQIPTILLLLLSCAAIMVLPDRWVTAPWFPGALALTDTAIVTTLVFLSGQVTSDLYLAYFVVILIATLTRTPKQIFLSLSALGVLYAFVLYREIQTTGVVQEHQLLRLPLLLIMAIFYVRTIASARLLREYDAVTNLPNRPKFLSLARAAINRARRRGDTLAVLFLNLDGFRLINDTLGHGVGDELLRGVATRLTEGPGRGHIVARERSDEFVVLVDHVPTSGACTSLAEEILRTLEPPFSLAGREIFVSVCIGIALFPQDAPDAERLVEKADAAMSRAKEQGQNLYEFYSDDINAQAFRRLQLAHSLRRALYRDELRVVYQPQMDLATGEVVGVEALVRWEHPELGLISPHQFIATAEETGLIVQIDQWMLRESCRQVKAWHETTGHFISLSVNFSARQLNQIDMASLIGETLTQTRLQAQYLELELTESFLLRDTERTVTTLDSMKALGIRLAIDDFGTGYSILSYLKRFRIDTLKIDQSFIRDVPANPDSVAIVKAIIWMSHALKLKVIAEGVEREEQISLLREFGCHECQGFAISRPLPALDIVHLLRQKPHDRLSSA